jgi:hypothetical protein
LSQESASPCGRGASTKHRGAIVRLLFNAVFEGVTRFRRKTDRVGKPEVDPKHVAVYWENGISFNIFGEVCVDTEESVDVSEAWIDTRSRRI